jgi:hypothetical protein
MSKSVIMGKGVKVDTRSLYHTATVSHEPAKPPEKGKPRSKP